MRINLTINEELASDLDDIANALGYTRSSVASSLLAFISGPLTEALPLINMPPPPKGDRRQNKGESEVQLQQAIAMLAFAAFSRQAGRLNSEGKD